jgi:hypothetical protein
LDNADSVVTGQFKITPTVTLHKILKIRNNIEWQLGMKKDSGLLSALLFL